MSRTLIKNFAAQVYSQAVTIAIQLGTVPILISAWGLEGFGVWMLLTAIPTLLAFSDFGFTFVAKNDMSMRVAAGDRLGALVTFQSILVLLAMIVLFLALVLIGIVYVTPFDQVFDLGPVTNDTAQKVLVLQIVAALVYQFTLLLSAGVRCEGRAALETLFATTGRLAEAGAIVAVALLAFGLATAAVAALAARLAVCAFLFFWLRRTTPWLRFGLAEVSRARLAKLFWPSVNYMSIPLSNALLIQAPVVLLGVFSGPTMVALFTVTRTVARMGMSFANMLNFAIIPEYSFAWGSGDAKRFSELLRLQTKFGAFIGIVYLASAWWIMPWGISLLSHGSIVNWVALSMTLVGAVFLEMLWSAAFTPLSAVNQHATVSKVFLIASVMVIGVSAVSHAPLAIAACIAVAHAMTLLFSLRKLTGLGGQLRSLIVSASSK